MRFGIQLEVLLLISIFQEAYTSQIDNVLSMHPPIDMDRGPAPAESSRSKLLHLINLYAKNFALKYALVSLGL